MTDFKVGDRVEYVGPSKDIKSYGTLTVSGDHGMTGRISVKEIGWAAILQENLRLITPTPDVLTIDRAELPEVVERDGFLCAEGFEYGVFGGAAEHRKRALAQLAVSEFLAAREKAEQDAADQHAAILNKRRDELARELFDQPDYKAHPEPFNYQDATPVVRAAIDRIIQLEGETKK